MEISGVLAAVADLGIKVIIAIIAWFVGRWLIELAIKLISSSLRARGFDSTVIQYIGSLVAILLNIVLILSILGTLGFQTTSFAALLAAAGIAIGAAWGGLLANFAAGVFLVLFRPFKVGDFITAGGATGIVQELGLFVTAIDTPDNVRTLVANNKIFSDTIQNFSINPYRRVDLVAQISQDVDPRRAIQLLKDRLAQIPNVLADPAPEIDILEFTMAGPVLAVQPFCSNDHYWQVYFDTNRAIHETFTEAGFPVPEQHFLVRQSNGLG